MGYDVAAAVIPQAFSDAAWIVSGCDAVQPIQVKSTLAAIGISEALEPIQIDIKYDKLFEESSVSSTLKCVQMSPSALPGR